jgi:cell division protein ZapA
MIHLDVTIMGQPYKLVCKEDEEAALRKAAAFVDRKMCAIRDAGKVKGTDRIAVMAALSMAGEFR